MAKLKINGEDGLVEGKVTISRTLVEDENGQERIVVEGALVTETYFEEIHTIDAPRFSIVGVQVVLESFGTEDNEIIYTFKADRMII